MSEKSLEERIEVLKNTIEARKDKLSRLGEVVQVRPEDYENLKALQDSLNDANVAFAKASNMIREASDGLWEYILTKYPDLDGYNISYNSREQVISIRGVLKD